jgi:hypothetical protein
VLKSRRGLLAAGLAVAVVGTIGVASTINAGAEEIADPPAAAPAAVASSAPVGDGAEGSTSSDGVSAQEAAAPAPVNTAAKPPPLLPWGAKPRPIKRGKAGLSSRALRATEADVAPADASGSVAPRGHLAPKGRLGSDSYLRSETTDIVPPEPDPDPAATVPPSGNDRKVNYIYNTGRHDGADTQGAFATMMIAKPTLKKDDYHTLSEIAVQSEDGRQIVEIGWNVDRAVNGDEDPHLFVFHWVNRKAACYNACGFVQHSKTVKPGDTLAYGSAKYFGIQFRQDGWWVAYDSEWIGYFPAQLWRDEGVTFERSGLVQFFGEVAASGPHSCTEMGTGKVPPADLVKEPDPGSAYITNVGYVDGPEVALNIYTTNSGFTVSRKSNRTFRFGGPNENGKKAAAQLC